MWLTPLPFVDETRGLQLEERSAARENFLGPRGRPEGISAL
jgi:hypothetical protein